MSQLSRDLKNHPRSVKWMTAIISGLLLVLPFILIPGFGSYIALRYFVFGSVALVLAILTAAIWVKHQWTASRLFKRLPVYGLLAYLFAFILVSLTGIDPALSFFSTFQRADGGFTLIFLTLFAFSVYTAVAMSGAQTVYKFLKFSVVGAVFFSILIGLSPDGVAFFESGIFEKSRGGATVGNSSLAVFYVVWNSFFALILLMRSSSAKRKISWGIAYLLMLSSPLFINWQVVLGADGYTGITSLIGSARGGLLGLLIGLVVALGAWLAADTKKIRAYGGRGMLILVIAGMCLAGTLLLQKSSVLHQKFIEVASGTRFIFWDSALAGFAERPILGFGPGTYSEVFHRYFNPDIFLPGNRLELLVDKPHNIFFEALAGGGIVLFLALCAFLVSIIVMLAHLVKRQRVLGALLLGSVVAWLIQMQFIFDSVASLALLFLVVGMGFAGGELDDNERSLRSSVKGGQVSRGVIMPLVVAFVLFMFVYAIVLPMRKARVMFGVRDMTLPARADAWQSLSGISPMGDDYDSVLVFANAHATYYENVQRLRLADPLLKAAALKELNAISAYLLGLLESGGEKYELLFLAAQIHHTHLLIDPEASAQIWEEGRRLTKRAIEISPTDPRPQVLLEFFEQAPADTL